MATQQGALLQGQAGLSKDLQTAIYSGVLLLKTERAGKIQVRTI